MNPEQDTTTGAVDTAAKPEASVEVVLKWMQSQPFESKLCAMMLHELLRHEGEALGGMIGNELHGEFRQDISAETDASMEAQRVRGFYEALDLTVA